MEVLNNSHRTGEFSKVYNSVIDPTLFSYQTSRRQSYIQRLYFEYLYTLNVDGSSFFYTFTYNDSKIPRYQTSDYVCDFPCFSYSDIRLITNGSLSKILLRKYGSTLKYLCACESGEGEGKRGEGNNSHYHFIFFIQPANSDYVKIKPLEFRHLLRVLWQGFDQNDKWQDFRTARFGIVKEGDNCGLITHCAPFRYVSKYVLKDDAELSRESFIKDYWFNFYKSLGVTHEVLWYYYKYNIELLGQNCHYIYDYFGLSQYNRFRHHGPKYLDKSYPVFVRWCKTLKIKTHYTELYRFFEQQYLPIMSDIKFREYINNYSGKIRCSKSLGEYGLNFIKNVDSNPVLQVPLNDSIDLQVPCLYYYRKLYYHQYKCDVTGNVLYRLNDLGVKFKCNSLKSRVESLSNRVSVSLDILYSDKVSPSWLSVFSPLCELPELLKLRSKSKDEINSLLEHYSIYKLVYEYRCYSKYDLVALDPLFSFESALTDYKRFLRNDSYFYDYSRDTIYMKLCKSKDVFDFCTHDTIKPFLNLFDSIDTVLFWVSKYRSICSKSLFVKNKKVSEHINAHLNSNK